MSWKSLGLCCAGIAILAGCGAPKDEPTRDEEVASVTKALGPFEQNGVHTFAATSSGVMVRTQTQWFAERPDQGWIDSIAQSACGKTAAGRQLIIDTQRQAFQRECQAHGGVPHQLEAVPADPDVVADLNRCAGRMGAGPRVYNSVPDAQGQTHAVLRRLQVDWSETDAESWRCVVPPSDTPPHAAAPACMAAETDDAQPPVPQKLAPREALLSFSEMTNRPAQLPAELGPVYIGPNGVFAEGVVVRVDCRFPIARQEEVTIDGMKCLKTVWTNQTEQRTVGLNMFRWAEYDANVLYEENRTSAEAQAGRRDALKAAMRKDITAWVNNLDCGAPDVLEHIIEGGGGGGDEGGRGGGAPGML